LLTRRTLINRIRYLEYMLRFVKDQDGNSRQAARDSVMAENTRWLADSIYKNEKLIVIGHNFHIAKHHEPSTVMGELLHHYYPGNTYSLGIFAGSGSYADHTGKNTKMLPPDSANTDLKHIIALLPGFTSYLHIPENKVNGTDWLHKNIVVNDTFVDLNNANKMIQARQFDGLLLLKKVSPPDP
ncbi:MAG: erythromycin esterase family protein, partial [Chitinophagaceae bacterium]|nr:erythromycin esterase family protein [Chitinophagaceae bacterium]